MSEPSCPTPSSTSTIKVLAANASDDSKPSVELNESGHNIRDVVCTFCGSVVLRGGVGTLVDALPFDVPVAYKKSERAAADTGDADQFPTEQLTRWWCVTDMFAFENVGFTHAHNGVKYLACADCEVGPIGLVDAPSNRFLIALDRIKQQ